MGREEEIREKAAIKVFRLVEYKFRNGEAAGLEDARAVIRGHVAAWVKALASIEGRDEVARFVTSVLPPPGRSKPKLVA